MTWAGRLLSTAWAVLWLRFQLVGLALRRFVNRPAAGTGYHLTKAETPVEGVDYDADELPADLVAKLEAIREELIEGVLSNGRRTPVRSVRGRRVAGLAVASLLTFAVVGSGAAALVGGSTGVPAVDRLLGIYGSDVGESGMPGNADGDGRDLQPGAAAERISVEAPLGSRRIVSASYVARDGRVCSALADESDGTSGDLVCVAPAVLAAKMQGADAVVLGTTGEAEGSVLRGFVSGRVQDLAATGPDGSLDVYLGERWASGVSGLPVLRPFLAIGPSDRDGLVNPGDYDLRTSDAAP